MTAFERFTRKIDTSGDCWNWTGHVMKNGYGQFRSRPTTVLAHRFAYELYVGPIPDGLHIDHLCRNRKCVRPDHLEAVTQRENTLRGVGPSALAAKVTHCPKGHPYDEANTCNSSGRKCRTCARDKMRIRHAKEVAART